METWKTIREFPHYSVSNQGRVRNDDTGRFMALTRNQQSIIQVGFYNQGIQTKRSVAVLVAKHFLEAGNEIFDTPIHLDGDRSNNAVNNLMWRPRWFAYKYHMQFKRYAIHHIYAPLVDRHSGETYQDSRECAIHNGLLEEDLVLAILNRTYTWPTYQMFEVYQEMDI